MQLLSDGECVGDGVTHDAIDVGARVEANRLHLRGVGLAVSKCRLLDRAVDNLPDYVAVLLVHRDKFAFKDELPIIKTGIGNIQFFFSRFFFMFLPFLYVVSRGVAEAQNLS